MTLHLKPIDRRQLLASGLGMGVLAALQGCKSAPSPVFSPDGLSKLGGGFQQAVANGYAPGAIGLVAFGSNAEVITTGKLAFDGEAQMQRNTIFRIASMTKAITAAAVMMLIEDGKLKRDEPIDRLIPELANRRVLRSIDAVLDDAEPARRPITVEDLLTFRCGYGLILAPPGRYPIQKAIAKLGIVGFGPPDPAMPLDNDQWIAKLATLPLLAQPGEAWLYTAGSNIQGVLVARATGQLLSRFCEERIFGPLGMVDTGFFVPAGKTDRFATAYRFTDNKPVVSDSPINGKWNQPPRFEQGDAGLVSTADDYFAFARMLLDGGRHRGKALLSPSSVKAMTTDHLTPEQRKGGEQI
ncbi:MAG TPA: serine hydrolase domain-containing protein, partial [Kofleriaceae bacterium]|nr:serine hydrolase domain-containing protein [Kofleriaceae bacterium]